jgi:hypothetical protein
MKAGFDGAKLYPLRGQFTWESQSVYLGFNYMFGASVCNANKEITTIKVAEDCFKNKLLNLL